MLVLLSRWLLLFVTIVLLSPRIDGFQKNADYSKESFVIEQLTDDVVFSADGTSQEERSARIRIQSNAAIQQFGVLTFPYRNRFERVEIIDIHVTKPDGSVIKTPDSDAQEVPTDVARVAPTYSDSRAKQVPVKGLGIGDVLVWRMRHIRTVADIPGQFWSAYNFFKAGIVLEETLNITMPAGKYVKVSSPDLTPTVREENNRVTYSWKTFHREVAKEETKLEQSKLPALPAIRLTTFRSWEEVGRWYASVLRSKSEVTPAVRAKAAELILGLSTNAERQRAIYRYVATKFRYISVSLGEGRYQPHSADEVLTNQYGDCKDKHTLFSALLRAAGITAWPALIGAGHPFDPDVPSPAQFNHLITYIPGSESALWLDTTPQVAPYGMLQFVLRDKQALVIPESGVPSLMMTPDKLPFPAEHTVDVKSKLSGDGTLTASFDVVARGDDELVLRAVFHATPPAQWTQLAQNMSRVMGFAGTVSDVAVDNPVNTEAPFHYSYNYERKPYSDWENRRFTPPIPPLGGEHTAEREQPTEPVLLGALGKVTYRATIQLPEGYSVAPPGGSKLQTGFADYGSSYSVDQGVLSVERIFTRKKSKVPVSDWQEYRKFARAIIADETKFIQLTRAGSPISVRPGAEETWQLLRNANRLIQNRELEAARDTLAQVEQSIIATPGLWAAYGFLYIAQNQTEKAIEALQREIEYSPGNVVPYRPLAALLKRLGRNQDALQTLRLWVKAAPGHVEATVALAAELIAAKAYAEAIEPLDAAVKKNPDNVVLEIQLLEALMLGGRKADGLALLAKVRERKLDPESRNNVAYLLAETNTELELAQTLAQQAVADLEELSKQLTLSAVSNDDLRRVVGLGILWDTLGWTYFRNGDLARAENFLQAAWTLLQHPASADHLGQLYERQGKRAEAIHIYRLALAVQRNLPETRARLEKLGGSTDAPTLPGQARTVSPLEELSKMRSVPVPGLSQRAGSAEFFLLFSPKGVLETRFISGDEKLKTAVNVLPKISHKVSFPDDGPERIARRGILSCSQYGTPPCNLVLLLPADTKQ